MIIENSYDSIFFGFKCGELTNIEYSKEFEVFVKKEILKSNYELIHARISHKELGVINSLTRIGFQIVTINETFKATILEHDLISQEILWIEEGRQEDLQDLYKISSRFYLESRFKKDARINSKKGVEYFNKWIENAVNKAYDDKCYILKNNEDKSVIGFCTVKLINQESARIGLIGINPLFQSMGYGHKLITNVMKKCFNELGVKHLEVSTQSENISAQNLYTKTGFKKINTTLSLHKWKN